MPMDDRKILEAIENAKSNSGERKFSQTIELILNLRDVDPKKPEDRFQELIEIPYKLSKEKKICVIASGDIALKARRSGADLVIERKELEALSGEKRKLKEIAKKYDFFIAEASTMPLVGRYMGSTLGPKGKMPTPVPPNADISEQIERHRRMILVRLKGSNVVRCGIGSEDMENEEILENIKTVLGRLERRLKRGLKSVKSIYLKSTMGKPVKIKL